MIEIKAASKITVVDGKFVDQRIYVDNAPLFEALERERASTTRIAQMRYHMRCRSRLPLRPGGHLARPARISEGLVEAPLLRLLRLHGRQKK